MPDGATLPREAHDIAAPRPDRKPLLCFVADAETEGAVREGLASVLPTGAAFVRGDVRKAVATLREGTTPLAIVVDISGHQQPLAALEDLAGVVEPGARVFVIGDREDLGFYRDVTQGLGVADYLCKPITAGMVAETFAPYLAKQRDGAGRLRGGRLISVTGARGGVGASTVAVSLAWHLADVARRHTVVLDADLHRGSVPLMLDIAAGTGLRTALEHPERVDDLFMERSTVAHSERLHVLASDEALESEIRSRPGAGDHLVGVLRRRYSLIVADVPLLSEPAGREIHGAAQQRVIVMEPTLSGIRDALRLLQLPAGPNQAYRPLLVVNRHDRRGALSMSRVEETMRQKPDILLPDLPRQVENAATMGQPAAKENRAFARGIADLALLATGIGSATPARKGFLRMFRR